MYNLIHPYDVLRLFDKIQEQNAVKLLRRLFQSNKRRIESNWELSSSPVRSWTEIPAVQRKINKKISGDENINHFYYTAKKYFADGQKRTALSLGCGAGNKEIAWAKTNVFLRIDAYDVSVPRIAAAKKKAEEEHLDSIIRFEVGDINIHFKQERQYDVIIAEGILHHLSPLDTLIPSLASCLKDEGLLVVNDYVGPNRFQWSKNQLREANAILSAIPKQYKIQHNGFVKRKIHKPGLLTMYLYDPSEAIESEKILSLIQKHFAVIEKTFYGGSLQHLIFKDIAHHYNATDSNANEILRSIFFTEDELLSNNVIKSDFVFLVCQKK